MLKRQQPVSIGAHRGWRGDGRPENTLSAMREGAKHADFVEVDLIPSANGFVCRHNKRIRFPGDIWSQRVSRLETKFLKHIVTKRHEGPLVQASDLVEHYPWNLGTPLLLDMKFESLPEDLIELLRRFPKLCCFGVRTPAVLKQCLSITDDRSRIVALPNYPWQVDTFIKAGAGVARLWQFQASWERLNELRGQGVQSLVMIGNLVRPGVTNPEALMDILARRPDFVLLDDPGVAYHWQSLM